MKQLLFLLLFPCLALAQYTGNAGQKITLGEQTTADGLVFRGRLADTANLLTNKLDTSVYIVLDTGTQAMWYYRASTTPKWTRLVDSLNNLQGTLSVAKGGTGSATQNFVDLTTTQTITGKKIINSTSFDPLIVTSSAAATIQAIDNTNANLWGGNLTMRVNGVDKNYFGTIGSLLGSQVYDAAVWSTAGNGFRVYTNGNNERMRITSGGEVWIGYTADNGAYRLQVSDSVYVGGNVSASAYTTRSDYDLKDEIQNIRYGLNEVMQMQPVKYTYKSNGSSQLGFIAQDLGVITPEVVSFEDKMSVYYNALIPILTKAIQEQQALIKALEQRILILENK